MRCSSVLVLGTLAVGQAAAANVRHASFHARRAAEKKRDNWEANVNWEEVSYDLSGVDWSSVFASSKPASTPTPEPTPTPSSSAAKIVAAEAKPTSSPKPTPAYTPPPTSSKEEEKPAATSSAPSLGDSIGHIVNDVAAGLSALSNKLGFIVPDTEGVQGQIWQGSDSPFTVNFINKASDTIYVYCWTADNWAFSLNAHKAIFGAAIKPNANETYSWAGGLSSACSAVYPDTGKAYSGGIHNTWFEVTFPTDTPGSGAFDVTRLPNMSGHSISAQGSKCLSDLNTCSFVCNKIENPDEDSCTYDYSLKNCNAANGGGGGIDAKYNAVGGGCSTAQDAENIDVTFS